VAGLHLAPRMSDLAQQLWEVATGYRSSPER
jgi:hypothetical protein